MIHIVVPAGNLFGIVNQTSVADYAARMRTSDQQMSGGASASCRPELSCPNRARTCPDYRQAVWLCPDPLRKAACETRSGDTSIGAAQGLRRAAIHEAQDLAAMERNGRVDKTRNGGQKGL